MWEGRDKIRHENQEKLPKTLTTPKNFSIPYRGAGKLRGGGGNVERRRRSVAEGGETTEIGRP